MKRKFIILSLFAIAMGYLESSVVVYLREIMYPAGFSFPLSPIESNLAVTEIFREAATLIMLLTVGLLAGKTGTEKFAWFLYVFAIWDIFYYVFLKFLIGWPESLMTWDILFLIPATWVGPVVTPVIVSLSMIFLAWVLISYSEKGINIRIMAYEWAGLITGSVILILGFVWDYSKFMLQFMNFREIFIVPDKSSLFDHSLDYVPENFNWFLFVLGQGIIIISILSIYFRLKRKKDEVWHDNGHT